MTDREPQTGETALLREALERVRRAAADQASRPYSEDGHVVGPSGLTVGDWRAVNRAMYDLPLTGPLATAQEPDTRPASVAGLREAWNVRWGVINDLLLPYIPDMVSRHGVVGRVLAATPPAPALDVETLARAMSHVENRTEMGGGQPGPQTMRDAQAVAAEYQRLREHPDPDAAGEAGL